MKEWVDAGPRAALLPGQHKVVWDEDTAIAVFDVDGELYAIEDVCPHDGGELAGGELDAGEIECPRHGARFDLRTGAVTHPPAVAAIAAFPVRVEDGHIWTRDDRFD